MITTEVKDEIISNEYPCLMEGPNLEIVLFENYGKGVVLVQADSDLEIGFSYDDFDMTEYTRFNGSVILRNS